MTDAMTVDLISLIEKFKLAEKEIVPAAKSVIANNAQKIKVEAKSMAPFDTGKLRSSIDIRWTGPLTATIGPNVPYGLFMEFGTGSRGELGGHSYVIRPKQAKRLVFKTKDGRWVTAKQVVHPGVQARPYMRPAAQKVLKPMAAELAARGAIAMVQGRAYSS